MEGEHAQQPSRSTILALLSLPSPSSLSPASPLHHLASHPLIALFATWYSACTHFRSLTIFCLFVVYERLFVLLSDALILLARVKRKRALPVDSDSGPKDIEFQQKHVKYVAFE